MRRISEIILHCTGTVASERTDVESIRRYHVGHNGWSDIGYHFVVKTDGTVEKGRAVEKSGAHVAGRNARSIGVCYVGGLDRDGRACDTRTPEQKVALRALVKELMEQYHLGLSAVRCHYEFNRWKACPGFRIEAFREELR